MLIVCIGDSLTQGFGLNQSGTWVEGIAKHYGICTMNRGVPGDTTLDMRLRLESDVISTESSHVFIMGGSNDILNGSDDSEIIENLRQMAELAMQAGIKPILMAPPPVNSLIEKKMWFVETDYDLVNERLMRLSSNIAILADQIDITYVDLFHHLSLEEWSAHFLQDGIHLRKSGHSAITQAIIHVLGDFTISTGAIEVLNVEAIENLKYLKAYDIRYRTKSGMIKSWEMVSRGGLDRLKQEIFDGQSISDGSVIFATDREHKHVVLLKEFRVGAGKYVHMLPAGLGDPGEDIMTTAIREFKEETGLDFEPVHVEPPRYVSIGMVNEKVSVAFGYYSGKASKCHQADNEDADILFVDKAGAERLLVEEEVTIRTAMLLQDFFGLNPFFKNKDEIK